MNAAQRGPPAWGVRAPGTEFEVAGSRQDVRLAFSGR